MVDEKSCCIIGAGISGLLAGCLLQKKGWKVTIFERQGCVGGRALSFDASLLSLKQYSSLLSDFKMAVMFSNPSLEQIFEQRLLDGFYLDLGYHAIGGGEKSNLNEALSCIDEHALFLESAVGMIEHDDVRYPFLSRMAKVSVLPSILRLVFAGEKKLAQLDSVSVEETIKRYDKPKLRAILEVFSRSISTLNDLSQISTGEMLRAQRNLYRGSAPVGYPVGGLGAVNEKLVSRFENLGGRLFLNTSVEKIIVKHNTARGVVVDGKDLFFDAVIYSGLVQDLSSLFEPGEVDEKYASYLSELKPTASLCAYYALSNLDSELIGKTFHFLERDTGLVGCDVVGMIDCMTASQDSGLAPKDKFLVQAYVICTPEELRDEKTRLLLRKMLDDNMARLVPGFEEDLLWSLYPAVWHLDGVAKTIFNEKPEIISPVENLFLVGDCVKAPGIGYNCAVNSARILSGSLEYYWSLSNFYRKKI